MDLCVKRFFQRAAVPRHTARGESPAWQDPNVTGKHAWSIATKHCASPSRWPKDQGSMPTAGSLERAFTARSDGSPWLRQLGLSDPLCRESQQSSPICDSAKPSAFICVHPRFLRKCRECRQSSLFQAGRRVWARNSATSKLARRATEVVLPSHSTATGMAGWFARPRSPARRAAGLCDDFHKA